MKTLICNDDGIRSPGILSAKKAIEPLCDTIVIAPERQQSGVGHSLTLHKPLRVNEVKLEDNSKAFSVSGTPTDCVNIGLFNILDKKPDLMISGINIGFNIGKAELTTSGTVGAAMEAASHNIPTIAISQSIEENVEINFEFAEKMLRKISETVLKKGLPNDVDLINVNIPSKPESEDIEIVKLTERMFNPFVKKRKDPRGEDYYWINGIPFNKDKNGTDGHSLKIKNKTTITPLKLDLASDLNSVKNWF